MTNRAYPAIYYAGFDPGSGVATLWLSSAETQETRSLSIPSFIAYGDAAGLLDIRSKVSDMTLAQVLRENEHVINWKQQDYYAGILAVKDGENETNALGDSARYWSLHSQVLLLALASALIPEMDAELRLVTALPVSLYEKENRRNVKRGLEGYYRFTANGRERELVIKVGAVVMEGQGVMVHHSEQGREAQAVIDIGERTTDLVAIDADNSPLMRYCRGKAFGVGQVIDEITEAIRKTYGRKVPSNVAHNVLRAYANNDPLPAIKVGKSDIPTDHIESVIERAINNTGQSIVTFISSAWNSDGARVGSDFEAIYVAGGGAYYFTDIIRAILPEAEMVEEPEHANVMGYHDLALGLEDIKSTIWER